MMKKAVVVAILPLLLALQPQAAHAESGVQPFLPDSLQKIEQAHRGEAFVLVLWSLDCVYCKASLKYLSGEARRRKLKLVTLATDSAEDPQVAATLRQRLPQPALRREAWAFGDAPPEQLRYAVDPGWYGELPRSYWYDAGGKRTAYSGVIDAAVLARHLPR